jgi:hypothetical protein
MTIQIDSPTVSPQLQRRIAAHRAEAARLRAELGDPSEALSRFVQETFSAEALDETYREYVEAGHAWMDREDDLPEDG